MNRDAILSWVDEVVTSVPQFLSSMQGHKRPGFYKYSGSGDYLGEKIKWGLGNAVFYLKITYILGQKKNKDIQNALNFVQSFQQSNGEFYDNVLGIFSMPMRMYSSLKHRDFSKLSNKETRRAETRQSISALALFEEKPTHTYTNFPKTPKAVHAYLDSLSWEHPWNAGSHFSHLMFFIKHSNLDLGLKKELFDAAIYYIKGIYHADTGAWYQKNPSVQEKINGAMKIITGLEVADRLLLQNPKKLIDLCLDSGCDTQACDNFNRVYVLVNASILEGKLYRADEITKFLFNRLREYKKYYFNSGGFSFAPGQANKWYYGAPISKGLNEPDIHGTVLFMWGISHIVKYLGLQNRFSIRPFIT